MKAHPEHATNTNFHHLTSVGAALLLLGWGAGCQKSDAPTPPAAPAASELPAAAAVPDAAPAPDAGPAAPAQDDKALTLEGFDPVAVCGAALDAASIPPVEVIGQLPDKKGAITRFEAVDGRFERTPRGASLRLAGQKLRECSPFAADGSIPDSTRFTASTTSLEIGSWTWPSLDKRWRYWNHVAVTDEQPWTGHGGPGDKGLLVVDEVDDIKRRVKGRLLICREGGAGWLAGTFDVTLCDK